MIRGSCLCGAVTYEIDGSLTGAGNCHCTICRKSHGAAFATWTFFAPDQFRWTSGVELIERYASSPGNERCFCSRCGSPLAVSHEGEIREVVLASIDGDPGVRPAEHIFTGFKAPWYDITDTLPQHRDWPPGMAP
ncbi:MAG TPA: GFA family protein [Halioglobus sp.]